MFAIIGGSEFANVPNFLHIAVKSSRSHTRLHKINRVHLCVWTKIVDGEISMGYEFLN